MSRAGGSVRNVALYRKYRPSTFAEVVGQSHVTEPLSIALDSGRINHAYLFSGPRGCGKTSSARIMARSLNCVEGPTSTPCGKCDSCLALGSGGAGHLDVTEIDAATHNGVEDMRDLRERAFFAPAESRYRVIIIDEAHMISQSGFNALLKIVEEPPEHLIFIFATTEPEKMLATIRSRTHNYPFRLLTPPDMRGLLESVVAGEGVPVEDSVYPLVIRAGGGSPRDSLSIMDQLLAGAGPEGVTYERAVGVLGMTDASLIDRAVEALAEQDQAGLFTVVDEVIDAGYDPRRFAEDLLDRFRDLLMVFAVPDAVSRGLVNAPKDVEQRLLDQSQQLGQATLTRCTALVNESLQQMRGATAPRLLLEIMCARMALPAAGMTVEALAQRVEQLERGGGLQVPGASSVGGTSQGISAGHSGGTVAASGGKSRPRYERPKDRREREAREAREAQAAQENQAQETAQDPQASQQTVKAQQEEPPREPTSTMEEASPSREDFAHSPQTSSEEDPVLAQARQAREILDRHRGTAQTANAEDNQAVNSGVRAEDSGQSEETSSSAEPHVAPDPSGARDADNNSDAESVWQAVLDELKAEHLSTWVAARDAQPYQGQGRPAESQVLYVKHHTGALANYINNPTNSAVLSKAAQAVTGTTIRVIAATSPTPPTGDEQQEKETEPAEDSDPAPSQRPAGAVSALERARAMAEASGRAHARPDTAELPQQTRAHSAGQQGSDNSGSYDHSQQQSEVTGWRARMDRMRSKQEYNRVNGFNGVPLPDEPPEDPWASGPPDPNFYGGGGDEVASAPQRDNAAEGAPTGQKNINQPSSRSREEDLRRQQEEEILEDLGRGGRGELDHRTPLEVAGELIEKHLGGERVR